MSMKIDLNCDMGESYGNFKIGNDDLVFPYITSCNIACGFHGGDPYHIEQTIENAIKHGLKTSQMPLKIKIHTSIEGSTLLLNICNTGHWIPGNGKNMESVNLILS